MTSLHKSNLRYRISAKTLEHNECRVGAGLLEAVECHVRVRHLRVVVGMRDEPTLVTTVWLCGMTSVRAAELPNIDRNTKSH